MKCEEAELTKKLLEQVEEEGHWRIQHYLGRRLRVSHSKLQVVVGQNHP